jgi:hypothetical protein
MKKIKKKKGSEKKVLEDFSSAITKSWEKVDEYLINFSNISPKLLSNSDLLKDEGPLLRDELKSSQKLSFQIFNLAKFYNSCGGLFEITDINLVNPQNMIKSEKLNKAIISFIKVYNHRKIVNTPSKENGKSDNLDKFFNLENVLKLKNRSSGKFSFNDCSSITEDEIKVKSSIIPHKSIPSGNFKEPSTTLNNVENLEKINPLGVIDEELSDWDN